MSIHTWQEQSKPVPGKKLIRFNQCKCGMKVFCRMFGQDPSCDEVVPDYPAGVPPCQCADPVSNRNKINRAERENKR